MHDVGRDLFGVHPAGKEWFLLRGEPAAQGESVGGLTVSPSEEEYQVLFRQFCESIAIRERRNLKLQQGLLPLRFREFMTEFQQQ